MKTLSSAIAICALVLGLGMMLASVLMSAGILAGGKEDLTLFVLGAVIAQSCYSMRHDMRLAELEDKR